MNQDNGGIIGKINTPTTTVASGVWSLQDQFEAQTSSIWPLAFPQTTIANACRFEDGNNDYLVKNFGTPTNQYKYTISMWVKRSLLGSNQTLFGVGDDGSNNATLKFTSDDQIQIYDHISGTDKLQKKTNMLFRDTSAWYHIFVSSDRSISSPSTQIYINGVQVTSFAANTEYSQNDSGKFNTAVNHYLGVYTNNSEKFSGYIAEAVFVDGQALTHTSFGAFNPVTNIWEPIAYAGTYGGNGFKLNFSDSSNLGDDTSGNGNDFTANNLTSIDQASDTCSNNFATLNALNNYFAGSTFSEGNLKIVTSSGNYTFNTGTIGVAAGKWYWEVKIVNSSTEDLIGITKNVSTSTTNYLGQNTGAVGYNDNGNTYVAGTNSSYGNSYTTNDIIGVALDVDNNKLYFSKNGTFQNSGVPTSGSTGTGAISIDAISGDNYFPAIGEFEGSSSGTFSLNFGSPPYTISSGNADANGHGNFEYAVPSGYFALCTKNLAEFG